jgi:putative membrane protein
MRKIRFEGHAIAAAVVLLFLPVAAWSGTNTHDTTGASQKPAVSATAFMKQAAIAGLAEVELGRLAEQKATSDAVKHFAKRMVDDHGKANDELRSLASRKNVTLPNEPDAAHKATYDRLSKLSGNEFDRAFMDTMAKDHAAAVALFEQASQSTDNDVQAFASRILPTLHDHQDSAQQIVASRSGRDDMTAGRPRDRSAK